MKIKKIIVLSIVALFALGAVGVAQQISITRDMIDASDWKNPNGIRPDNGLPDTERGPGQLIDDSGMSGPGLDAMVMAYLGNHKDECMLVPPTSGQTHPGIGVPTDTNYWIEISFPTTQTGGAPGTPETMGIWPGNEWGWGSQMDVRDFVVLTSMGGTYTELGDYQLALTPGAPNHVTPTVDLPVGAIVDLSGVLAFDSILIAIASGNDVTGGNPGDFERNWSYGDDGYSGATYYNEACLGEIRLYPAEEVLPPSNCSEAMAMGYSNIADVNNDCYVNLDDFSMFLLDWLRCMDPQGENCEHLWQ